MHWPFQPPYAVTSSMPTQHLLVNGCWNTGVHCCEVIIKSCCEVQWHKRKDHETSQQEQLHIQKITKPLNTSSTNQRSRNLSTPAPQTAPLLLVRILPQENRSWLRALGPVQNLDSATAKGELLFSSVRPLTLIYGHWLCFSSNMHHILAQHMF